MKWVFGDPRKREGNPRKGVSKTKFLPKKGTFLESQKRDFFGCLQGEAL